MARKDSIGLFWEDVAKVKAAKKEKIKRTPPERFWESPDYLPGYEEAVNFVPDLYTDMELYHASQIKEKLLYDIEVYPNYCLFAFKGVISGKVVYFEMDDNVCGLHMEKFKWVLENFCLVNFNGLAYDFPITAVALAGYGTLDLWNATDMLIGRDMRENEVFALYGIEKDLKVDQIDLIQLTALAPGLKVCAGRLHAPRLQDLPFKPGTYLTEKQITILRRYCINDLDNTGILYKDKLPQIALRQETGKQYKLELRSKSDAQMAEAIMDAELKRITGKKYLPRTKVDPTAVHKYIPPKYINYSTPLMNWALDRITSCEFKVDGETGAVIMPTALEDLVIEINQGKYKIGIGGLHSQEKSIAHEADDDYFIADTDATSYYPYTILNAGLYPENLGKDFILVYNGIVVKRVTAKEAGDIVVAECLKIVANGTFGKLGSKWSIVYAPNLMIQVTLTGQLSILMLVERFELVGIQVISVNTDGIVVKCLHTKEQQFKAIVKQWEVETGLATEEVRYKGVYSRDINNYIAVYEKPQKGKFIKAKGVYGETAPKKNAVNEICIDAIKAYMTTQMPIEQTIRECKKISAFTTMRRAVGGAVKGDTYLGSIIRWYYALGEQGEIINAKTGAKIARSEGGKPCMDLPKEFPDDIDYDWYINETYKILKEIGYKPQQEPIA